MANTATAMTSATSARLSTEASDANRPHHADDEKIDEHES